MKRKNKARELTGVVLLRAEDAAVLGGVVELVKELDLIEEGEALDALTGAGARASVALDYRLSPMDADRLLRGDPVICRLVKGPRDR